MYGSIPVRFVARRLTPDQGAGRLRSGASGTPAVRLLTSTVLKTRREAAVYEGPHPAEGQLPVNGPAEEQHGIRFHHYRGGRARRVPAGEERDTGRTGCPGRKDGHR